MSLLVDAGVLSKGLHDAVIKNYMAKRLLKHYKINSSKFNDILIKYKALLVGSSVYRLTGDISKQTQDLTSGIDILCTNVKSLTKALVEICPSNTLKIGVVNGKQTLHIGKNKINILQCKDSPRHAIRLKQKYQHHSSYYDGECFSKYPMTVKVKVDLDEPLRFWTKVREMAENGVNTVIAQIDNVQEKHDEMVYFIRVGLDSNISSGSSKIRYTVLLLSIAVLFAETFPHHVQFRKVTQNKVNSILKDLFYSVQVWGSKEFLFAIDTLIQIDKRAKRLM